jgi:hypothetical protein
MTDLTWPDIQVAIPLAERAGVSEKARSRGQIVDQFKKYKKVDRLPQAWQDERRRFIARHMAQYEKNPTYRRFLALVMWGYLPDERPPGWL